MATKSIIQEKSFTFAVKLTRLYKLLLDKNEYILSRQLVRSGTSIGANVEEALGGQTRKDFHSKMTVAYKESRETHYWLRVLKESGLLGVELNGYIRDVEELNRILASITKTTKAS